ncbi:hypothetical protein HW115_04005 [Verrucomicrobiaceae bacterium N1E253]|uniref:Porin n=1 Tax=Oceaniferula marina TaxID=2748318 RepID=A0A851GC54_9BACT|nr:hypothetical protein [Oceaniferula marina]NWK54759.1 hypothetical protein [Oceaniferula marina]
MKNTIITGAAAIALAAPSIAGTPVTYTAPEPAPSNLGLSGDLSLAYQSQWDFRGISTTAADAVDYLTDGNSDTDNIVIAELNAGYAFTENFSLVGGATVRSLGDTSIDHNTYRFGALWQQEDCFSIEVGYQYHDLRTIVDTGNLDELYANFGFVCPWTGTNLNLFWAHSLDGLDAGDLVGDSDVLDGDYLELNGKKTFELNEWASLGIYGGIAYGFDYWSNNDDFTHWFIGLDLPLKATEYLTVTPYVTYTDGLSGTEDVFGSGIDEGDEFLWGVKASVNF